MAKPLHEYDFHRTAMCVDPADIDWDADLYLSQHFVELVALEYLRIVHLAAMKDADVLEFRDDGYAYPTRTTMSADSTASIIMGWRSGSSFLTRTGRAERRAIKTLADEMKATGRIRVKMLPDFPGLRRSSQEEES